MKLILLFLLISSTTYCQQEEKAVKLHVNSTELQVTAQNGGWTKWSTLGKMNDELDQTITINFTKKTFVSDYKLKESERKFYTYRIVNYSHDKTLGDFGFYITTMKVEEADNKIIDYKLTYSGCNGEYILITYTSSVRTRYFLTEL